MLTRDAAYHDLGGDYFGRLDPERAIRQANALGFTGRHRDDGALLPARAHPGAVTTTTARVARFPSAW
jgi:hypothetical protein